jgi:chromosome segregation ATPase
MVSEHDVLARYQAYEQELQQLEEEIVRLQWRVKMGTENWRIDLEQLAERAERRRALTAQRQALHWVLDAGNNNHAPSFGL